MKIKEENREKLLNGRSLTKIAKILGYNFVTIQTTFAGRECPKRLAMALISLAENISLGDSRMEELLEYYFEESEK